MLNTLTECRDTAAMLFDYERNGRGQEFWEGFRTCLRAGEVNYNRLSLRRLYETFTLVNEEPNELEVHRWLASRRGGGGDGVSLMEAGGTAVMTAAFSNIFGQITYQRVLDVLERPQFIADSLMTTVPATTQGPEVRPGVAMLGDVASDVGESEDYPRVGLSEEFISIEPKIKDGFILPITEETIWEDNTGLILRRADAATESMAITQEKEKLDTILGVTTRYSRNGGPKQATYGNTHTQGDFDNLAATNALVDYTDIEAALLLFDAMTDPNTGEPITLSSTLQLIAPSALHMSASSVLNAIQLKLGADSGAVQQMVQNPLNQQGVNPIQLMPRTPYVKDRTSSDSTWFIGDFPAAFEYVEVWPIQMFIQRGQESESGFNRDVVHQVKVRRKGVPAVVEPRKAVKSTA